MEMFEKNAKYLQTFTLTCTHQICRVVNPLVYSEKSQTKKLRAIVYKMLIFTFVKLQTTSNVFKF